MLSDFFQDWLINKLNGYFLVLYSNDHFMLAWITECMNNILVFVLELVHLIPPRRRYLIDYDNNRTININNHEPN